MKRGGKLEQALAAYDFLKKEGKATTTSAIVALAGCGKSLACQARDIREKASHVGLPSLTATAQQKLEAWQHKLEREFDYRVRMASKAWIEGQRIPIFEKKLSEIERMLTWPRNSVMTKDEYNVIIKCLHPDGLRSRTEEQLAEAFRIFTKYKLKMVADEEARKAVFSGMPRTREEMLARKKKQA